MLRVGEDTAGLDTQLVVTATYYEGELDYKIKKLTSMIEPVVSIAMGLMVGFVAVALVSAMYAISARFSKCAVSEANTHRDPDRAGDHRDRDGGHRGRDEHRRHPV